MGVSGNPAVRALDRARAEAKSIVDSGESWSAELHGKGDPAVIVVPPWGEWEPRAVPAWSAGDFDTWAEAALDAENFKKWRSVRPTFSSITEWFARIGESTGEDMGESEAS